MAATLNGEGSRFLDAANRKLSGAYGVFDAMIGLPMAGLQLALKCINLSDRREPILPSSSATASCTFCRGDTSTCR